MMATAHEIVHTHYLNDLDGVRSPQTADERLKYGDGWSVPYRNKADLLTYKEREYPGLTQNISQKGFDWKHPIQTGRVGYLPDLKDEVTVLDGHHRLAAMYHHRPNEFLPMQTRNEDSKRLPSYI